MSDKILRPRLNLRQRELLLHIKPHRQYSIQELKSVLAACDPPITSLAPATLRRDISQLVRDGVLMQLGDRKGTRYTVNLAGQLHTTIDAHRYCELDIDTRSGSRSFNSELFAAIGSSLFTEHELTKLKSASETFFRSESGSSWAISRRELERFVIEFAWKSSKIEGNTYSLLDTELLLKEGLEAKGHTREETVMILNHKKAFEFALNNRNDARTVEFRFIEQIHRTLVEDLGIKFGIRQRSIGITGSIYKPLEVSFQIREACEELLKAVARQVDPYSQALLLLAGIAYIQPFEDGNKRCSRLSANALLIAHDHAPISYRSVDELAYREAVLTFYEKNTIEPLKELFIEQYIFACNNYLKFTGISANP
jgi:Fic family protein